MLQLQITGCKISPLISLSHLSAGYVANFQTMIPVSIKAVLFFSEWDEEPYRRGTSITDMNGEVSGSSPGRADRGSREGLPR